MSSCLLFEQRETRVVFRHYPGLGYCNRLQRQKRDQFPLGPRPYRFIWHPGYTAALRRSFRRFRAEVDGSRRSPTPSTDDAGSKRTGNFGALAMQPLHPPLPALERGKRPEIRKGEGPPLGCHELQGTPQAHFVQRGRHIRHSKRENRPTRPPFSRIRSILRAHKFVRGA